MKNIIFVSIFFCLTVSIFAQTQMELNEQASVEYGRADAELNAVYQQIRVKYASNQRTLNELRDSQRLWIQFRDAQIKALYPVPVGEHMEKGYGSMYPQMMLTFQTYLTRERTQQLRQIYLEERFGNYNY
jgi:uncharacterized protein YecT (DUF1311 family)